MATPIDLQTVYSQLSNVARSASVQQQAQLSEAMQQQNNIQKNLENSKKVQSAANEKATSAKTNEDGSNADGYYFQNKSKNEDTSLDLQNEEEIENNITYSPHKDPNLGNIIDITR